MHKLLFKKALSKTAECGVFLGIYVKIQISRLDPALMIFASFARIVQKHALYKNAHIPTSSWLLLLLDEGY